MKRITGKGLQVYFSSTEGHLYDQSLDPEKPYKVSLEAYEVYSHYELKRDTIRAIKIELIDMDAKKHRRKIYLNQLDHDENKRVSPKEYCYPARFYKSEDKIKKQRRKELRKQAKQESMIPR